MHDDMNERPRNLWASLEDVNEWDMNEWMSAEGDMNEFTPFIHVTCRGWTSTYDFLELERDIPDS